jgi:hypothetical protein
MSKYTHFIKLKHLIFLNGGSILHIQEMRLSGCPYKISGLEVIHIARLNKGKRNAISSVYQIEGGKYVAIH